MKKLFGGLNEYNSQNFTLLFLGLAAVLLMGTIFVFFPFDGNLGVLSRKQDFDQSLAAPNENKEKDPRNAPKEVRGHDSIKADKNSYKITHLVDDNQYIILIKNGPIEQVKNLAITDLRAQGVDTCVEKVNFVPSEQVLDLFTIEDTQVDCSIPTTSIQTTESPEGSPTPTIEDAGPSRDM